MPWWQWVIDVAGLAFLLALLYGLTLVLRRRWIARRGGTFELSHRLHRLRPDSGWVLGMGRYTEDSLEWFRVFSLSPRPRTSWRRGELVYDGRRDPRGPERHTLYPDHLVICCQARGEEVELAMSPASLTGFQSWLEARRPGTDWSR